ncbi:MAG TPA: hypothetical protein VHE30_10865 [Polyangiaceae bacterium]|nr:hypothetical protein [Polyangiaceae bacterium]
MTTPLGDFGPPPDRIAWGALAASITLFVLVLSRSRTERLLAPFRGERRERAVVFALALVAFGLSLVYVERYLRGGPRIVDATTYFLQGRALSEGHVAFHVPAPSGSFRGRFLLASDDGRALAGIFPPGYPAYLAVFFRLGAPMLGGPVLAATLVVLTGALAKRLFADPRATMLAAALSAVSGVLRYHTADTMSHGLAATFVAGALLALLADDARAPIVVGVLASLLVATRPVSGAVLLAVALLASRTAGRRLVVLASALPGLSLFLAEQWAVTGFPFLSSQRAYYAVADSPPGCFRYGFGDGIGCLFEHGDFVRARLAHGYGLVAALGTTLRRLKMHLADAGNAELFFVALVPAVASALRRERERPLALVVLGIVIFYAPFYFDGNYPGGGARFYADVLPLEHVLLAGALVRFGVARFTLPLALAGFAVHTSYDHLRLRDREGGRPMFEPSVLAGAGVARGLVFVDTDHGFSLGFDPDATDPRRDVVVARRRRDAHDALLWARLGRPPVYDYVYEPSRPDAAPRVAPVSLDVAPVARFEAEAEWPPLRVSGASVLPGFHPAASRGRLLRVIPVGAEAGTIRLEAVPPAKGRYAVRLGVVPGPTNARLSLRVAGVELTLPDVSPGAEGTEAHTESAPVELLEDPVSIDISTHSTLLLDYVELRPVP